MCITLTPNATCYYLKIRVDLSGQSAFSKEAEAIKAIQNLFDQIFPKEPTEETLDPAVSLYKLSEKITLTTEQQQLCQQLITCLATEILDFKNPNASLKFFTDIFKLLKTDLYDPDIIFEFLDRVVFVYRFHEKLDSFLIFALEQFKTKHDPKLYNCKIIQLIKKVMSFSSMYNKNHVIEFHEYLVREKLITPEDSFDTKKTRFRSMSLLDKLAFTDDLEKLKFYESTYAIDLTSYRNREGVSLLHFAARSNISKDLKVLRYLVEEKKMKVDTKTAALPGELQTIAESSVLHYAVYEANLPAIEYLVARGAALFFCNQDGDSLLHIAFKNLYFFSETNPIRKEKKQDLIDVIAYLLQQKLNVHFKNKENQTSLDLLADLSLLKALDVIEQSIEGQKDCPAIKYFFQKLSEDAQLFSIILSYPGLAIIGLQPNQEKPDSVFHFLLEKLKKTPPKEFTTQEYVQSYMTAFLERLRI